MRPSQLLLLAALSTLNAQTPIRKPATAQPPTQLPITRVSLYKNGVGFFEHAGRVSGSETVTIDFTTAQLDDVLQSITAIDLGGGRIAGAGYNSTTPLDQQLRALPFSLPADADSTAFYTAIRGARVEVHSGAASITGRLLNIDIRTTTPDKEGQTATETRWITVVSDTGTVRTLPLTPATEVRLLDPVLHGDVSRYLQLLADTRGNQVLRRLTLQDNGEGVRDLRVSYISEVPVWKSTYRILFTDPAGPTQAKQTATLQGWSVVDNTTGTDWVNVQLSLIAGAPQSFIQPLSVPYYSRRPEIPLPQEAQLSPQTHESGEEKTPNAPTKIPREVKMLKEDGAPPAQVAGLAGMAGMKAQAGAMTRTVNGAVLDGFVMGAIGPAPQPMIPYEQAAADSLFPQTITAAFDDYFAYTLAQPITIRKNESALVPILQTKIDAERVTLWSPQNPQPLRALWITNTSDLTLDRGSFSIVEGGNFGGEGLLDPIHPKERRLLSYAADQAVRVSTDYSHNTHRVERITVNKGVLRQSTVDISEVEYLVSNAAPDLRTVVVEHPVRQGWTIDSDPKPTETTLTENRFQILVKPGEAVRLHIGERHPGTQSFRLVDQNEDQLALILRNATASPALLTQLEPVLAAKRALTGLDRQIEAKNAAIAKITEDQTRLRANLAALKGSAEERALVKRYTGELNTQEDQLAALHHDLDSLNQQHQVAAADLSNKIEALTID